MSVSAVRTLSPSKIGPYPSEAGPRREIAPEPALLPGHVSLLSYQPTDGPLFDARPRPEDAKQGFVANCNVIAAFSAVAAAEPEAIERAISPVDEDTFEVRLYQMPHVDGFVQNGNGTFTVPRPFAQAPEPDSVETVEYLMSDALPLTPHGFTLYASSRGTSALWAPLLEKAFAQQLGTYRELGMLSPGAVMAALTGRPERYYPTRLLSEDEAFALLSSAFAEGKAMCASTYGRDQSSRYLGTGLAAWHWYSVLEVTENAEGRFVTLRNPKGGTEPEADGVPDGVFEMRFEEFLELFKGVYVS